MAKETITKCDGCGIAAGETQVSQCTVEITGPDGPRPSRDYDLCEYCDLKLTELSDPNQWERKKPRKARKA